MPWRLAIVRYVLQWRKKSLSGYRPGAFSSCTGIFQTSGKRDSSKVSSSSRQVSSWESNKTWWGYLEAPPASPCGDAPEKRSPRSSSAKTSDWKLNPNLVPLPKASDTLASSGLHLFILFLFFFLFLNPHCELGRRQCRSYVKSCF